MRNILVLETFRTIPLRDPRSSGRHFGKHPSKASSQMKTWGSEAIAVLKIPIRSAIRSPLPSNSGFPSWNVSRSEFRMPPLPARCFRVAPMMLVMVRYVV